jgi:FAD/FMN-containing dehydrogenases
MTVNVDTQSLIASMRDVVGQAYLLTDKAKKQPYTKGFRFGAGEALAVVRPGTLVEIWRVLKLCVEAGRCGYYAGGQYRVNGRLYARW